MGFFVRVFLVLVFSCGFSSVVVFEAQAGCSENLQRLTVVTFNAYNLFDGVRDGGKKDQVLPGYSQEVLDAKVEGLKKVLMRGGKCLPDIACGVEIENENTAHQLATALGYKHIFMTRSPDARGIDVALFFNDTSILRKANFRGEYPYQNPLFHSHPSRNLQLVDLDVGGHRLILVVVHWPSMMGPTEMRIAAAKETKKLIEDQHKKFPDATIVMLGDTNTIPKDVDENGVNPFTGVLLPAQSPDGIEMFNVRDKVPQTVLSTMPPGTYYYAKEHSWNELDRVAVYEGPFIKVDPNSYQIYVAPESSKNIPQTNHPVPKAFKFKWVGDKLETEGVTDHFPVFIDFTIADVLPAAKPWEEYEKGKEAHAKAEE